MSIISAGKFTAAVELDVCIEVPDSSLVDKLEGKSRQL
jgi:hypothetical protein